MVTNKWKLQNGNWEIQIAKWWPGNDDCMTLTTKWRLGNSKFEITIGKR